MAQKIVYGIIAFDDSGSILQDGYSGTGDFTIARTDKGIYTITFDQDFNEIPCVTVTQINDGTGQNTNPTDVDKLGSGPRANANLVGITTRNFRLKVGNDSGSKEDRMATFMAIGQADD